MRSFVGSCAALVTSVCNLSVLTALDGEPGYICLCLCNLDSMSKQKNFLDLAANYRTVLFVVSVLHWATQVDRPDRTTTSSSQKPTKNTTDFRAGGGLSTVNGGTLSGGKSGAYIALDDRPGPKLTTKIEANRNTMSDEAMVTHAIEVKTQHVREVEVESYETDLESGRWRESQEASVKSTV